MGSPPSQLRPVVSLSLNLDVLCPLGAQILASPASHSSLPGTRESMGSLTQVLHDVAWLLDGEET